MAGQHADVGADRSAAPGRDQGRRVQRPGRDQQGVDDRLVVIRGIDAGDYHPEEAADVEAVDVATRTVLKRYRQKGGGTRHAIVSRCAGGAVLLVVAEDEDEVVVDPFEANDERSAYTGHRAAVRCLAAAEVDGRTIVASGDRGNGLHFWDLETRERLG
ncbi:hypothetical protein QLQ12_39060 [Actinoplanes sp. NEAU-A12]|uniref:WD40 repeat domain-containing protein n=1 Tax=Actinoplanes sandaracinus TaxID=3045177 RepID=A0ABT6WXZ4_9ACTN|nr:hypothetical protein [Actinoplanes sandaracinus]MDI6104608.1 hypothetical protein [Actinoplanes sandaracinus]